MLSNQATVLEDDFYKLSSDFYVLRAEFSNNELMKDYEAQVLSAGGFSWFNVGNRCRSLRDAAEKREGDKPSSRPSLMESVEYSKLFALFRKKKDGLKVLREQLEGASFHVYKTSKIKFQLIGNQPAALLLPTATHGVAIGLSSKRTAATARKNRAKVSKRARDSKEAKATIARISQTPQRSYLPATNNPFSKPQNLSKESSSTHQRKFDGKDHELAPTFSMEMEGAVTQKVAKKATTGPVRQNQSQELPKPLVRNPAAASSLDIPRKQPLRSCRLKNLPVEISTKIANKAVDAYDINPLLGEGVITVQQIWKHYFERQITWPQAAREASAPAVIWSHAKSSAMTVSEM